MIFPALFIPVGVLAFVSGLFLGSLLAALPLTIVVVLIMLAGTLSGCERRARVSMGHGIMVYACVLFGVGYWALDERMQSRADFPSSTGRRAVTFSGAVSTPVAHRSDRVTMTVAVRSMGTDGAERPASGTIRVTWREPDTEVFRGDTVTVRTRLRPPFGSRNPGGFDYGAYLRAHGIHAVATVTGPDGVRVRSPDAGDIGAWAWRTIDQWRHQIRRAAVSTLEQPARGIFLGVIVGEQDDIPSRVRNDFMTTGTVHILSISGSHLGMLAFVSFFGVRMAVRRLPPARLEAISCVLTPAQLAVLVTIPAVVFYTLLSGSHVATVRSLMMVIFYLFAVWVGYSRHMIIAVSLAAFLTTLADPGAIHDLSFQLSYVAVLAIALGLRWSGMDQEPSDVLRRPAVGLRRWWEQRWKPYLVMTFAVTLATMPLVAYYFNQVAWLGIMANAVIVPLFGLIVVPLGLGASVLVLLGGLASLPLGWVQQTIMDGLTALVGMAASIPGARWHVASPSLLAIAGFYLVLLLTFFGRNRVLRWAGMGLVMLCLGWWVWSPRHLVDADTLRVTFLDVGQGDATVLELPDGQTVLVDAGIARGRLDMGEWVVGPYLWDQGIRRLDHVIATHPQLDHVGGLPWILENFEIDRYWSNGSRRPNDFYRTLETARRNKGLPDHIASEGKDIINEGPCRLRSLHPPSSARHRITRASDHDADLAAGGSELNNLSVVLSLQCGRHSILLTADVETDALTRLTGHSMVTNATVVKIPHHGAKSSLNQRWIEHLNATVAVVSSGAFNRYGHPSKDVLRAYRRKRMDVYRTDTDGAIRLVADPDSGAILIRRAKDRHPVPLAWGSYSFGREWENLSRLWNVWARNT